MNRFHTLSLTILALIMTVVSIDANASGRGRHKKLYAVPTPGPITIDGDLSDWDLSGQIFTYVVPETADMQSSRLAMMYDGEALYISGVVRDTSPMMNRHDPKVDPNKAWDADVCQVFISLDPRLEYPVEGSSFAKDPMAPVGTMLLWHFTDRQEACLAMYRGMRFSKPLRPDLDETGVIPSELFDGAYQKADDEGGYTFEYRIPFETIGLAVAPKANDILAIVTCTFWSRPDGLKTAGGAAWAYDVMAGPGFPWQSTLCYGKLIFSPEGDIPAELVTEGLPPEKPLPLKFSYDIPEDSQVTVQIFDDKNVVRRILVAQGDRRAGKNTELWDGLDDQGAPLPAGEYRWAGIYHEPITQQYRFAPHNSGQPTHPTDNNRGGWGGDHGSPTTAVAVPGGMVLAWGGCEYGWGIIRVNLDGKKLWGSKHSATYLATDGKRLYGGAGHGFHAAPGVKVWDLKDCRPTNFGNGSPTLPPPAGGDDESNHLTGLAYAGGKIYAAYAERDTILIFDANSGDPKGQIAVPKPERLTVEADGSLLVISAGSLLRVSAAGEASTLVPADHAELDAPTSVTTDGDGAIYVANAGSVQAVSVFDASGKFLRTVGKRGGRPAVGAYDKSGMYMPGGMAFDEQQRLWVAETTDGPKRHSVWDPASGENLREFFGASSYFGWGYIDPVRPDEIYAHNVLWKIDWETYETTPITTIWRQTAPDMAEEPAPSAYNGTFRMFHAANGKQYGWGKGNFKSLLYLREGDVFKPIAGYVMINRNHGRYKDLGHPVLDDPEAFPDNGYFWQDLNGDQRFQPEEMTKFENRHLRFNLEWVDADLNLWSGGGLMLRPTAISEAGLPTYDATNLQDQPIAAAMEAAEHRYNYLWIDPSDSSIYTLGFNQPLGLCKWSPEGELLWSYPNILNWHKTLNLPIVKAGRLWGMTGPLGADSGFTGNMTYFGVCHLFQPNGVYTAALNRDGRTGGVGADVGQPEGQTGQFVKLRPDPNGPERYFLIQGGQDSRVTEIMGLDTIQELPGGVYQHTPEAVAEAKAALDAYNEKLLASQKLTIARGRKALDLAEPVGKSLDAQRGFQVRAAYDDDALYLRYDITTPIPVTNSISEPSLIFKGGNLLDIQIAADPDADPERKTPAPGDQRILVTQQGKKPFAVIYRTKVADFDGEPVVFNSPTGSESFDQIEITDAITLDVKPTRSKDGYVAIVTIPHSVTGLSLTPGQSLRMDVGYIFGNKGGSAVATRAYWHNNSFTANVTNDIPHESRLEPSEWGTARVE